MAVTPQNLTNEYGDDGVVTAATETIDGHEYAVLDVYNSTSSGTINGFMNTSDYLKFVLKEDLVYQESNGSDPYLGPVFVWRNSTIGKDVVLDFNGHIVTLQSPVVGWEILAGHLKIYDSSAAGTGGVKGVFACYNRHGGNISVDIYGGTFDRFNLYASGGSTKPDTVFACKMYGGVVQHLTAIDLDSGNDLAVNTQLAVYGGRVGQVQAGIAVPAYLHTTRDADGNVTAVTPYDAYCVSTSNLVTGAYNYAYGLAWEISALALDNLAIPTGKTYYLWARDKDGWYQYLNLRYIDGVWRNAA